MKRWQEGDACGEGWFCSWTVVVVTRIHTCDESTRSYHTHTCSFLVLILHDNYVRCHYIFGPLGTAFELPVNI